MYKALVIGCGSIGALYDLKNNHILTHAKAYATNKKFKLWVYDTDNSKSKLIAKKYKTELLTTLDDASLKGFDFVSICTPTDNHFKLLQQLIALRTKLIICEKPISYSLEELNFLKKSYLANDSKIVINYIRRFHPAYKLVKKHINSKIKNEKPTQIVIKYKRGFLNNTSHAFDTINYLLGISVKLGKPKACIQIFDAFSNDPTLTCNTIYNGIKTAVIGLTDVNYPLFEIEIYYQDEKILILNSGNEIAYYNKLNSLKPSKTWNNAIENYMKYVIKDAIDIYENRGNDNFLHSLELNKTLLQFIK
ncbi:MAG: Gfo/Idh/MocA family oxidoreductase [Bacteroidia bacterium]